MQVSDTRSRTPEERPSNCFPTCQQRSGPTWERIGRSNSWRSSYPGARGRPCKGPRRIGDKWGNIWRFENLKIPAWWWKQGEQTGDGWSAKGCRWLPVPPREGAIDGSKNAGHARRTAQAQERRNRPGCQSWRHQEAVASRASRSTGPAGRSDWWCEDHLWRACFCPPWQDIWQAPRGDGQDGENKKGDRKGARWIAAGSYSGGKWSEAEAPRCNTGVWGHRQLVSCKYSCMYDFDFC